MKHLFILMSLLFLTLGCSKQGDDRLVERSKNQTQGEIEAEKQRAAELVKDLRKQSLFYEALYGEFEGDLAIGEKLYKLRIKLVPHLPIYISDERSLTVKEAEDFLINQSFNIQILTWASHSGYSAFNCMVEGIKPDLTKGQIFISSESCSNLYHIAISESELNSLSSSLDAYDAAINGVSADIAQEILSGEKPIVDELVGEVRPSNSPNIHTFKLKRVN